MDVGGGGTFSLLLGLWDRLWDRFGESSDPALSLFIF